jgi:hypothetical protein
LNRIKFIRLALVVFSLFATVLTAFADTPQASAQAVNPDFASDRFAATWNRTDFPIKDNKANRSWYWGPEPRTIGLRETYADSPGKTRLVQYFDKARMEINDPSKNTVTNGLLVVEMINGRRQEGDKLFVEQNGAVVPIAGDPDNKWPTYASLGSLYNVAQPFQKGQAVTQSWNPEGTGKQEAYANDPLTLVATIENKLAIPAAFWSFLNSKGSVYTNGQYREDTISDWLFSTGYPITGAYWTKVKVGGVEKDVLFQAFERRTLTYTPSNQEAFRVEMGNVGLHYMKWRYPNGTPRFSDPLAVQIGNAAHNQWYEVTGDTLNIRTGPSTDAPNPPSTKNKPYIQRLVKGNRIQVIRSVKGEAIEKGNDTWFQIYESPDLFVYSGYVRKFTLPEFAKPPKTYPGLWVSVDLTKQMMAIFEGNQLVYRTMIASGIPNDNDPKKDFRTPTGVFRIDGSYRPLVQSMEGGNRAVGGELITSDNDYYKIEDIRNVSYFYQDYAIHGSYWHARYGIAPQSHGCVNATVYDAGLIYKLKAGTTVEVFYSGRTSTPANS